MDPETKACPFCAETILAAAVKCKHCQSDLRAPARPTQKHIPEATKRTFLRRVAMYMAGLSAAFILTARACAGCGSHSSRDDEHVDRYPRQEQQDALAQMRANVDRAAHEARLRKECQNDPSVPIATVMDDAAAKHDREVMLRRCISRKMKQ